MFPILFRHDHNRACLTAFRWLNNTKIQRVVDAFLNKFFPNGRQAVRALKYWLGVSGINRMSYDIGSPNVIVMFRKDVIVFFQQIQ